MFILKFVQNQIVPEFTRRHADLDRLGRELGPVLLEVIRSASKNPRVLSFLSLFVGFVILKKLFDFFLEVPIHRFFFILHNSLYLINYWYLLLDGFSKKRNWISN